LNNKDRLDVDIEITNGGYITIKNMDSNIKAKHYYSGKTRLVTAPFKFDRIAPIHCSVDKTIDCPRGLTASSMLSINGSLVRKQSQLKVSWDGWFETAGGSGISKYTLEIYQMESKGSNLSEKAAPFSRRSFSTTMKTHTLQLTHSGLFSVVLYVHDVAGNYRIARRLVLYDNSSLVAFDRNKALSFPQAVKSTSGNFLWKTTAYGRVLVDWTGYFYNTLLKKEPLLRRISSFRQTIDSAYDQQATGTLGLSGTLNNDGIVRYLYASAYGLNPTMPADSKFKSVHSGGTILFQQENVFTRTFDGYHITVWVRAFDVWGNYATDNGTVHVDFSPPYIKGISLLRHGETLTYLNSEALHKMRITFDVTDYASGVVMAFWKLGETDGGNEMGEGRILTKAKSKSDCPPSNCSCTDLDICSYFSYKLVLHPGQFSNGSGQHGRSYYLTINTTNDAQLTSSKQVTITVDSSPPQAGHVIDGLVGQLDIDSQQSNSIQAYWLGFNDRDSGIHHYKYAIATSCLKKDDFTSGKVAVHRTNKPTSSPRTVGPGTYYTSVIAYNNALEPSDVVCSDGVTVDRTPPTIEQISVSHIRSTSGIIKETNGQDIWLVDENRRRQLLPGFESVCAAQALVVKDISVYPISASNTTHKAGTGCPYGPSSQYFFTSINRYLSVSWKGSDTESGIHDYRVGMGRTQSEDPPSVLNFQSTNGLPHYSQKVASLTEGLEYFVIIEATNKAGVKTRKAVGPVIVDVTPPHLTGKLQVNHNVQTKAVFISWTSGTFVDPEDSAFQYKIGAGVTQGRDDILPFTAIDQYQSCQDGDECVSLPSSLIESKAHSTALIFFAVQATNGAGLYAISTSDAYVHIGRPPTAGTVFDQLPSDEPDVQNDQLSGKQHDIDYQTSLTRLRCRWTGFTHPTSSVSLQIGVGTRAGSDNIVQFRPVDSKLTSYEVMVSLRPMTTYFFTVTANNSFGNVSVSSDGIKPVSGDINGTAFDGTGCLKPSSYYSLSSINDWSRAPATCASDVSNTISLTAGCLLSASVTVIPGQWYSVIISSVSSTSLRVMLADTGSILLPQRFNTVDHDQWETAIFPFRSVSSEAHFSVRALKNTIIRNVQLVHCEEDVDYQSYSNAAAAHWSIDKRFLPYVTHYLWALFRNASDGLDAVTPYTNVGNVSSASVSQLSLRGRERYVVGVKACNPSLCFNAFFSDGFEIMSSKPVSSDVIAKIALSNQVSKGKRSVTVANGIDVDVTIEWDPFTTFLPSGRKTTADVYSWTIRVPGSAAPLIPLRSVTSSKTVKITETLYLNVSSRRTLLVVVRGYNQVGHYSEATAQLVMPSAHPLHDFLPTVFDVQSSKLAEKLDPLTGRVLDIVITDKDEIDFTNSQNTLAASWPWLKHGRSEWNVIRERPVWRPCNSSTYSLACGITTETHQVVKNLQLKHGIKYFFCIKVLEIAGAHGVETKLNGSVVCSDGVTVDSTAPTPGVVFLGQGTHGSSYQTFTDTLLVRWTGFADVEEIADVHAGIMEYSVAIGTSPGKTDIRNYVRVGSATHKLYTGLTLRNGETYYATINATDHVQQSVTAFSNSLTLDTTAPTQGQVHILGGETGYITGTTKGHWTGFNDKESGIAGYQWCFGSSPGHNDAITCRKTTETNFKLDSSLSERLMPGKQYFVTVKGVNNAGLETVTTSNGYVFDDSPPTAGTVLDSELGTQAEWDYQQLLDKLSCQWMDFQDPHSSIHHYSVAFGSEETADVVPFHDVGKFTNYTVHVPLEPGRRYYCTVVACNQAEMCTTVTSDGIIADNSPPAIGMVLDGLGEEDIQYQSYSDVVGSKWFGFHDPHSSISHYEWCAGSAPGKDDLVPWTDTLMEEMAVKTGLTSLSTSNRFYTSVRAYNKAGLSSMTSSDGFLVDNTPPTINRAPSFNTTTRSNKPNTQYSSSIIQTSWKFDDQESPIYRHTVTIFTRDSVSPASDPAVVGSESQTSVSQPNITLHDGERYYVSVTACNAAGLCIQETSPQSLLIDTTPPLVGFISDHLTWNLLGTNTVILLKWNGFSDAHTGIHQYIISVGSTYSGNQYTPSYVRVNHTGDVDSEQKMSLTINVALKPGLRLYVSLWATNGVGLRSDQLQVSMVSGSTSPTSGVLTTEKHSCVVSSCLGHCTCAASNGLCDRRLYGANCTEVPISSVPMDSRLIVWDFLTADHNLRSLASINSLQGSWKINSSSPSWPPLRYEVTAGKITAPGDGIYDITTDKIWHDVGLMTSTVITLPSPKYLFERTPYTIYVRVWYSGSRFAVFRSPGVTPDISPPTLSSRRHVLDRNPSTTGDVDFITRNTDTLSVSWEKSFTDSQSGIDHFIYGFGTSPEADDVTAFTTVSSDVYWVNETGLTLSPGIRYYATVQAINLLGLYRVTSTDGVVIDTETPQNGVVLDGDQQHDLRYQSNTSAMSAQWHGFFDRHSYIKYYQFGIGDSPRSWNIHHIGHVGLRLFSTVNGLILTNGITYYATVIAFDAAGLRSSEVSSDGVTVDSSPPVFITCERFGLNLLEKPHMRNGTSMENILSSGWSVVSGQIIANMSESGKRYAVLSGVISKEVAFTSDVIYELRIQASPIGTIHTQHMEVVAPGMHRVITLRSKAKPKRSYAFQFVPGKTERSNISISSASATGDAIIIDSVELRMCEYQSVDGIAQTLNLWNRTIDRQYLGPYGAVEATWRVVDPQSGVKEALWAIGTVQGGQQLQTFQSVGMASHAVNRDVDVRHGTEVFVTIVAINNAGLASKFQLAPLLVDFTPPEIAPILIEKKVSRFDVNFLYLSGSIVTASWNGTSDAESGIDYCKWGIGLSPMSTELLPFQIVGRHVYGGSADIGSLRNGQKSYVTVQCYNYAGLSSTRTSEGIPYIAASPDSRSALVTLDINTASLYKARGPFQTNNDSISVHWVGFEDQAGLASYQIKLEGNGIVDQDWFDVGLYTRTRISGLALKEGHQYTVAVRAVNYGGLLSSDAAANFTVVDKAPTVTGNSMTGLWTDDGQLVLSWTDSFVSDTPLIYELTVGTHPGSGNVLQWLETTKTLYTLKESMVDQTIDYYVTVTAIDAAGLHASITSTVIAKP
jgi:hypothetical protein